MDKKLGVYICKGCDIGKSLDIDKLTEVATGEMKCPVCKTFDVLCNQDAVAQIRSDIDNEGINRVIVAACSQRVFPEMFEFGGDVLTFRANLREQVVWSHEPGDEDTQMLAEDQIRMAGARLDNIEPPEPHIEEINRDILVVGGGITGLTAARAAAAAGYKVSVVEKEDRLGGWATKWKKVFPKKPPYTGLEDTGYAGLVEEVEANPDITVYKSSTVAKTSGEPGHFSVDLQNGGKSMTLSVGSVIQATGFRPYNPEKLGHLGYGSSADVITNVQMEEMVSSGAILRPSDGKPVDSVVFVQCAGSRDEDHLPYCSAVCCRVSLKQAMYVREQYPDAKIYVIYKDVRSPAQYELFYASVQEDEGVFLTKGEITAVTPESDGTIGVEVGETLMGENIRIRADLVVLAAGMVPTTKVDAPEETGAETNEVDIAIAEVSGETADGKKEAESAEEGAKILNLTYRQGTDLPTLKYGFPDSHFICFPYETRRTAVYAAGAVRAPMDLASCANDAHGAALKSIQALESVARGAALHPRSGDLSYPEFNLSKCTQCKRCTEECPFGALDEDEKGTPLPNLMRCRRCGTCFGACPERIISFKNHTVNSISQMIKSISMPDEIDEKPRILAFVCENDALPALEMAGMMRMKYNAMIRIIPLRCLGSMSSVWVGDALASGFDGVILMGCAKGDDYQCHFVKGSEMAEYRMGNVKEKLKQLVLEEERVEIHDIAINDYKKIPGILDDFLAVVEDVGLNPYKDM
jgi:quinone-modifying oxidoreductase subunit QmoB